MKTAFVIILILAGAGRAFAVDATPTSLSKEAYLKILKESIASVSCGGERNTLRMCYSFSLTECKEQLGLTFDICAAEKTKSLPDKVTEADTDKLKPVVGQISGCAADLFMKRNKSKIIKEKCPKLAGSVK